MSPDLDYDLTHDQWEALKALRNGAPRHALRRLVIDQLAALELAAFGDGTALLTATGRSVLLRGSLRLLDLAA